MIIIIFLGGVKWKHWHHEFQLEAGHSPDHSLTAAKLIYQER